MTDSIDREAQLGAGLDPDDPEEWAIQWRIQLLLTLRTLHLGMRHIAPYYPVLHAPEHNY
ncbi:hypothetical protein [Nocardia africana]